MNNLIREFELTNGTTIHVSAWNNASGTHNPAKKFLAVTYNANGEEIARATIEGGENLKALIAEAGEVIDKFPSRLDRFIKQAPGLY